jgi:hypothetical protein
VCPRGWCPVEYEEGVMGMSRQLFVWSLAPRRYQAARVQLHCPATDTHTRELILEQATIY